MKREKFNLLNTALLFITLLVAVPSCVKEEYDIDNLDTTIQVGGDNLLVPLGSTKDIIVYNLIPEEQREMLQPDPSKEGTLSFNMADKMDFSDKIPNISEKLKIDPINLNQNLSFDIPQIDQSQMTVPQQNFDNKISLDQVTLPEVTIPQFNAEKSFDVDVAKYKPSPEALTLSSLTSQNVNIPLATISSSKIPGYEFAPSDMVISIPPDLQTFEFPAENINIKLNITLPEGVTEIKDIKFGSNSKMSLKMSVGNPILQTGSITPEITVDVSKILTTEAGGKIALGTSDALTPSNNFTVSKDYKLTGLVDLAWNDNVLDQTLPINIAGKVNVEGSANKAHLDKFFQTGKMVINIEIAFSDIQIADLSMKIPDINKEAEENMNFDIPSITLPEQVNKVCKVAMQPGSKVNVQFLPQNFRQFTGLTAQLKNLKIEFPTEIRSRQLENGIFTAAAPYDISEKQDIAIEFTEVVPKEPVNGEITFTNNVKLSAKLSISGNVKLSELPSSRDMNPKVQIKANSNLAIDDYSVEFKKYVYELDSKPEEINIDLGKDVGDFGTFSIIPKTTSGTPQINIDIVKENLDPIGIRPGDKGIVILFPEMIRFKNVNPDYGYNAEKNSITLSKADIFDQPIVLDIDKLVVTPVKDPTTGNYYAKGTFDYSGSIVLGTADGQPGEVTGKKIQNFIDKGVQLKANIPEMSPETISFDEFTKEISQTQTIDLFTVPEYPEGVDELKIETVALNDTKLNLGFKLNGMPELGTDPDFTVSVTIPEEIVIDKQSLGNNITLDDNNVLTINGTIQNNKFDISPIAIKALDLSEVEFTPNTKLSRDLTINGKVSVMDPTVRPEDLKGTVIIDVEGGIPSIGIDKALGKIGYSLEKMNQTIDLSKQNIPDFLKGDDFTLDLANPHIEITIHSNIGIPVKAGLVITPHYKDREVQEGDKIKIENLVLPASESASLTKEHKFWLSFADTGIKEGFEWKKANIPALLRRFPETIDIEVTGGTDAASANLHIIEPNAKYLLDLDYNIDVPLEFGEDTKIHFEHDMNLDLGANKDMIVDILKKQSLGLKGKFASTLPFKLNMNLQLLDSKGNVIPTKDIKEEIWECGKNGETVTSDLDIVLELEEEGFGKIDDLAGIRMLFDVATGNAANVPLTDKSYVQARLSASVPGGVTFDPMDMGKGTDSQTK